MFNAISLNSFTFSWILSQHLHFLLNLITTLSLSLESYHKIFRFSQILSQYFHFLLNLITTLSLSHDFYHNTFTFSQILSQNFLQFHFISSSQTTTRLEKFWNKSLEINLFWSKQRQKRPLAIFILPLRALLMQLSLEKKF